MSTPAPGRATSSAGTDGGGSLKRITRGYRPVSRSPRRSCGGCARNSPFNLCLKQPRTDGAPKPSVFRTSQAVRQRLRSYRYGLSRGGGALQKGTSTCGYSFSRKSAIRSVTLSGVEKPITIIPRCALPLSIHCLCSRRKSLLLWVARMYCCLVAYSNCASSVTP